MKNNVINELIKEFYPEFSFSPVNISKEDIQKVITCVIYGDVMGAQYEFLGSFSYKKEDLFPFEIVLNKDNNDLFTDDTVMTIATLDALVNNRPYHESYKEWGKRFPNCGYGARFRDWIYDPSHKPYSSIGNGAAMRVSPVLLKRDLTEIIKEAYKSAETTHNNKEGIKGAVVTAVCLYLSFTGNRNLIKKYLYKQYKNNKYNKIWLPISKMNNDTELAPTTVPYAIKTAIKTKSVEDFCTSIINKGGDTDTALAIGLPISVNLNGMPDCMSYQKLQEILYTDMIKNINKIE